MTLSISGVEAYREEFEMVKKMLVNGVQPAAIGEYLNVEILNIVR